MKKLSLKGLLPGILATVLSLLTSASIHAQVAINTNGAAPDTTAMLDVSSSDKGILIPRMDSSSRTAILQPADGLMVYDTTTTTFWYYDEEQWNEIRNGETKLNALDLAESLPEPDFSCTEIIAQLNIPGSIKSISLVGNYLYVLGGGTLNAINISDPNNPIIEGTFLITGTTENMIAIPGYVFIVQTPVVTSNGRGVVVIDVNDPTNMVIVDDFYLAEVSVVITFNHPYLYVSTNNGLDIYDVSDPTNFNNGAGGSDLGAEAADISILGDYAYVVGNIQGAAVGSLEILDISNVPSSVFEVSSLSLGNAPVGVAVSGNYAYVIDDDSNDLRVIDVSTPSTPNQVASLNLGGSPKAIEIAGNYAYVVSTGSNDLKVIDISNPTNPALIRSIPAGQANHIEILGNYAYVANANLNVFELSCPLSLDIDPSSGEFVGTYALQVEGFALNETTSELTLNSNQFTPTVDLSAIRKFGNINAGIQSTDQGTSNQAGNGFTTTPWVYTNAVEAQGERGSLSTLITIGDDGTYGADDEIHLVTDGNSQLEVDINGYTRIGNINMGSESLTQSVSAQSGNGFTVTPWVYTNAIEAQGERLDQTTLITIGDDGVFGADDQIHLVTDGNSRLQVGAIGNTRIGTINMGSESSSQNTSNQSGNGFTVTPWVYTNVIEAQGERDGQSTLITVGDDGIFGANDEIRLVTSGNSRLRVNTGGNIEIEKNLRVGAIGLGNQSTIQASSTQADNGFTTTPWIYTKAIHDTNKRGALSTLITLGNDGVYGATNEIHLVTNGISRLQVNGDGKIGIGRNPTARALEVNGNASKSSAGDWLANSDARLKKNIQQLNAETTLEKLLSLKGITYEWDDNKTSYERPAGIQYGFTAQNIQEVFPTLVEEDAEGYLQTAYGTYDAMYVEAFRALQQQIINQQEQNTHQQRQIEALQAENQQLQQHLARIQEVEATLATLQQQLSSLDHSTTTKK